MEEEGWLDQDQPEAFVEVINSEGETLGWLEHRQATILGMIPQVIESPPRYLEDPYIDYHSQLIEERKLFEGQQDLNDIQLVLVGAALIKRRKAEVKERDRIFEENLLIGNPEMYKAYMDKKSEAQELEGGADVEQRVPGSVEEFLATLAAFSEGEDSDSDKEQENAEGWLASFLSDSDLDQMQDD